MARSSTDKLMQKRRVLVARTSAVLKVSEEEAHTLLSIGRRQSVRINPLRGQVWQSKAELDYLTGSTLQPYDWMSEGYSYGKEASPNSVRDSQLLAEGKAYIQNVASWLPVVALDAKPGDGVLDVCAAPGGKTSHIAAHAHNQVHITANDNSRPRLAKLRANLERLGVQNVDYTLFDATQIARKLEGNHFDKILLDAPCSGEGMMQFDRDKDFDTWSVAQIKRLQQLQKKILVQAWQLLKSGGTLVYSTCTMAPEENEAVVDYLLRHAQNAEVMALDIALPNCVEPVMEWNGRTFDERIKHAMRLKPSEHIEAFFVCKLQKHSRE